jgi:hypothetical protein
VTEAPRDRNRPTDGHAARPLRILPAKTKRALSFRLWNCNEYNCVKTPLVRAGFQRTEAETWNIGWSKHLGGDEYSRMNPYQKCNHWPGSWALGRKDRLSRNVDRFARVHGESCLLAPKTYWLPGERSKLKADMEVNPRAIWILKPPASSCGRGIVLACAAAAGSAAKALPAPDKHLIAQQYVSDPYLINGYKFDLRIYVLVTSYNPLRVYMFRDGLARFATRPYNASLSKGGKALKERLAHLTNYAVNKSSQTFVKNESASADGVGSKWSLLALLKHLRGQGVDTKALMGRIHDIVIKTLLSAEPELGSLASRCFRPDPSELSAGTQCFELFGFDVLLDSKLRPWVLEVNVSPSLSSSSPMDRAIKHRLLTDVFHMVGVVPYDPSGLQKKNKESRLRRLLGQYRPPEDVAEQKATRVRPSSAREMAPERRRQRTQSHESTVASAAVAVQSVPAAATAVAGMPLEHAGFQSALLAKVAKANKRRAISPGSPASRSSAGSSGRAVEEVLRRMSSRSTRAPVETPALPQSHTVGTWGSLRHRIASDLLGLRLEDLLPGEWKEICDLEDECERRGHFTRIYPTTHTATSGRYATLFEVPRFYNVLMDLWMGHWRPLLVEAATALAHESEPPAVDGAASGASESSSPVVWAGDTPIDADAAALLPDTDNEVLPPRACALIDRLALHAEMQMQRHLAGMPALDHLSEDVVSVRMRELEGKRMSSFASVASIPSRSRLPSSEPTSEPAPSWESSDDHSSLSSGSNLDDMLLPDDDDDDAADLGRSLAESPEPDMSIDEIATTLLAKVVPASSPRSPRDVAKPVPVATSSFSSAQEPRARRHSWLFDSDDDLCVQGLTLSKPVERPIPPRQDASLRKQECPPGPIPPSSSLLPAGTAMPRSVRPRMSRQRPLSAVRVLAGKEPPPTKAPVDSQAKTVVASRASIGLPPQVRTILPAPPSDANWLRVSEAYPLAAPRRTTSMKEPGVLVREPNALDKAVRSLERRPPEHAATTEYTPRTRLKQLCLPPARRTGTAVDPPLARPHRRPFSRSTSLRMVISSARDPPSRLPPTTKAPVKNHPSTPVGSIRKIPLRSHPPPAGTLPSPIALAPSGRRTFVE